MSCCGSFIPRGLVYVSEINKSFFILRGVLLIMCLPSITEIPLFVANSVDPDQTTHSEASDLGLYSLLIKRGNISTRQKEMILMQKNPTKF